MGSSLFGTDGIRAPFGSPPLDEETVRRLGTALARQLRADSPEPRVLLAGDTRHSTPTICRWLAAELAAAGCGVLYGDVLPTPAVSYLVAATGCDAGIAVSASHNPLPDNGIKLFDGRGRKWSSKVESRLEQRLTGAEPAREQVDELQPDPTLASRYLDHLCDLAPGSGLLAGSRVVLDAAHGASSAFAAPLFERLGAKVTVLAADPDGHNINVECGSTVPEGMAAAVRASGADFGFAFDGDADRALAADETGAIHDGDALLYVLALALESRGLLERRQVVATSMSNIGLEMAFQRRGIGLVRCDVGDREVVRTLRREGLILGGEQSGHIVRLDIAPTGDGLQTALLVAAAVVEAGASLSELLADFRTYPQVLYNVRVDRKPALETLPSVSAAARSVVDELGSSGRLVLRYSGTEPLARIMIEGPSQSQIERLAHRLEEAIVRDIASAGG